MADLHRGRGTAHARSAALSLRRRDGALTQELVRAPGGFGLGQVPERLRPDQTARMVCGFCSTGCGLEIHLRNGEAINLSPSRDYSVNRGVACPKGWEALTPLRSPDRATRPLLRNAAGKLQPVSWEDAGDELASELLSYCREHLATFKCPRSIDFDEQLPRLPTGKLYKKTLRDRYWGDQQNRILQQ